MSGGITGQHIWELDLDICILEGKVCVRAGGRVGGSVWVFGLIVNPGEGLARLHDFIFIYSKLRHSSLPSSPLPSATIDCSSVRARAWRCFLSFIITFYTNIHQVRVHMAQCSSLPGTGIIIWQPSVVYKKLADPISPKITRHKKN